MSSSKSLKCVAVNYGPCGGHLNTHPIIWHCRPRSKDLLKGHVAYDSTTNMVLCVSHEKQIKNKNENNMLPELYGWDLTDALDWLVGNLTYTSDELLNRICDHCEFRQKTMGTETGACSSTCQALTNMGADWDHCRCSKPVTCICPTLQNNELHWAVFTYVNGFQDLGEYDCNACMRPSWRDGYEEYKNGLTPIEAIMELAKKNPNMILERNIQNQTPLTMIQPIIELLMEEAEDYYAKPSQIGFANSNMTTLKEIKKGFMEVLDAYAN
jgi:hypothetical protein